MYTAKQANSVWPTPSGQLRLANSVWPTPSGQLRLANSVWAIKFSILPFRDGQDSVTAAELAETASLESCLARVMSLREEFVQQQSVPRHQQWAEHSKGALNSSQSPQPLITSAISSETGKTRAKCKHCPTEIEQGTTKSTAKLEWHLKTKHPIIYQVKNKAKKEQKEAKKEVLQNKLNFITPCTEQTQDSFSNAEGENEAECAASSTQSRTNPRTPLTIDKAFSQWSKNGEKTTETEDLVMIMIAVDGLSMLTTDKPGFLQFVGKSLPNFEVKGRRYYREVVLPRVFERLRAKMLEEIKSVDWLSITSDIWSSKDYNHSLLAITAHFIDLAARPQFRVIATVPLKEIHKTGQIISGHLLKALEEVQIDKTKIHLFMRDGASNMVLAAQTVGFDSFHCFLHIINLAIKQGLIAINFDKSAIFEAVKTLIRKIRKSQNIEVRWSSLHQMLTRFIENREAIEYFIASPEAVKANKNVPLPKLSAVEWEQLRTINSRSLTIGAVLPFFLGLKRKLRDPLQPPETFELCDAIVAKLDSLFSGWESKKFLICATVLDPRVKLKLFEHLRERARAWLSGDLRLMTNSVGSILRARADSGPISENDVFAEMIDDADSLGSSQSVDHTAEPDAFTLSMLELDRFLGSARIKPAIELPYWWNQNRHDYPWLYKLYERYHSAPRLAEKFKCPEEPEPQWIVEKMDDIGHKGDNQKARGTSRLENLTLDNSIEEASVRESRKT
uniref:Transposase n=1 Tax=Globodera rostochiensis TaxID=31243 RepID=A0A914GZR7_GLORO